MARRKKIYRDKEYERDLRRERIREYVTYIFVAALIIAIFVIGINQTNDRIVGFGLIVLGLLCICYVVFDLMTRLYEWKTLTGWDTKEFKVRDIMPEDIYHERLEQNRFAQNIIVFLLTVIGVVIIVAGILRLIGKI